MDDVLRSQLITMHYNDIINTCQSKLVNVCDNPQFWLDKMKFEINYYNIPFYDQYEFLREALNMGQTKYFAVLLSNPHLIPDNKNINHLFFQYGFITDDIKVMEKFSDCQYDDIFNIYQKKGSRGHQVIKMIIQQRVFIINDYYNMLSLCLKNYDFKLLKKLKHKDLPVRFHPRLSIFDKLIHRYIGIFEAGDFKRIKRFKYLLYLYCHQLSSYKRLFNLIYDTYEIKTLGVQIYELLYGDLRNSFSNTRRVWISDDLNKFKVQPQRYLEPIILIPNKHLLIYNYDDSLKLKLDFCYDNGKIIYWIITEYIVNNRQDKGIIYYLSIINLSISQFKLCLQNLNEKQFHLFIKHFFVNTTSLWNDMQWNRLRKSELIISDSRFRKCPISLFKKILLKYCIEKIERDCAIFLRERIIQPLIEYLIYYDEPEVLTVMPNEETKK